MKKYFVPLILTYSACGGVNTLNSLSLDSSGSSSANYAGAQEPAARIIFNKNYFTDLSDYTTSKSTQFQCLGNVVKVFYPSGGDYTGTPAAFPTSSTSDDFAFTNMPAFLKNIAVDMTNTYYPISTIDTLQTDHCSYRGVSGSTTPNSCADFDSQPSTAPGPYTSTTGAGVVTTFAGTAGTTGHADGTGTAATFNTPVGVVSDSSGNLYIADSLNETIRKITSAGVVTTFAGTATTSGSADGIGTAATFNSPSGVAIDSSGNLYVADSLNSTIRMITSAGTVTTYAGTALSTGSTDGAAIGVALFNFPTGVAVDSIGNVYVADAGNSVIRKISTAGIVSTLAGSAGTTGSTDGTGAAALFNGPNGVAVDWNGDLYVADGGNHLIRKVTSAGVVTTVAGVAGSSGTTDGLSTTAKFNLPTGVAVDEAGNVFVADKGNSVIREIISGVVTTLAGSAGNPGTTDSSGTSAKFHSAYGLGLGTSGLLYVADSTNSTIRKITIDSNPTTHAYYGSNYYRVRDDWCTKQGPILSNNAETTKAYVGGVNIDLDRSALGAAEDVLLNITYQAMNSNSSWPGTQTSNDDTILRVNLIGTGLGLANLLSAKQPYPVNDYSNFTVYLKEIATLRDPFSSLRTEQVLVPLSENSLIDRIRLERVRGSFQLYQIDLYRLGNRAE